MPITIREGCYEDAKQIASVNLVTWQKSYRDFFPHEKLDNYSIDEYAKTWEERILAYDPNEIHLFVAENDESGIVGFASGGKAGLFSKPSNYDCEIFVIYVLNEYHGIGIGKRLVQQLLQFFRSKKWKTMIIWAFKLSHNRVFYERMGGIPKESQEYEKWDTKHEVVGFVWEDISKIPLLDSE